MLARTFIRLCAVALLVALLATAGTLPFTAQAQPAQTAEATAEPTVDATETESPPNMQATKYPPCPPTSEDEPLPATAEATAEATAAATQDASVEFAPAYLGIAGEDVADCGSRIIEVVSGSPADRAGLQLGDVIVAADGAPRRNLTALRNYILTRSAGETVVFVLKRDAAELEIAVVLGVRPRVTPPTVAPEASEPTAEATQGN